MHRWFSLYFPSIFVVFFLQWIRAISWRSLSLCCCTFTSCVNCTVYLAHTTIEEKNTHRIYVSMWKRVQYEFYWIWFTNFYCFQILIQKKTVSVLQYTEFSLNGECINERANQSIRACINSLIPFQLDFNKAWAARSRTRSQRWTCGGIAVCMEIWTVFSSSCHGVS